MPMLRCGRCSADVPSTAKYCPNCGVSASFLEHAQLESAAATIDDPLSSPINLFDSPDEARFVPGQILAERYRIVALLGKGGMGEVYRAHDLRLGQTVALKFLPEALVHDGPAQARFHREVRLARQVSHPNVCRVFDIGETAGLSFLSMEYVDGEDLASLLRRIGRLPQDKAVEIARQLCAGLAAAHDAGVLHRDMKPANVMLDRRGRVRITDFGLAGLAIADDLLRSGTPSYMAPEQLAGEPSTQQSDIYSLGLVLYEIFTGKRVFEASTLAELIRQHESRTPTNPSQFVQGLDPVVERVILRCLEADPGARPRTALQVAAALPGGDPLAAALAAGETPSPEMVAAAGGEGALQPATAWLLLLATLAMVGVILMLTRYSTDIGLAPPKKTLSALEVRAQEIIERAGYSATPADHASWFQRNYDFLLYQAKHFSTTLGRRNLDHASQGVLEFFYRQSPRAMVPENDLFRVGGLDPPYEVSGMITVALDSNGRLLVFAAVPPQVGAASSSENVSAPDWPHLLAETGLDTSTLRAAPSDWFPPVPFEQRFGWRGYYPEDSKTEIQVSAASYRGQPVYFQVIGPWSVPWRAATPQRTTSRVVGDTAFLLGGFVTLILAALFARHNIRLDRGDRKGAFRISAVLFSLELIAALLVAHHVSDLAAEWQQFTHIVSGALFFAAFVWLYYLAFEPYVRRQLPELLIAWSRLLSGEFRNPRVGRDMLAGLLLGSVAAFGSHLANSLPTWFNLAGQTTVPTNMLSLGTPQELLAFVLLTMINGIFPAFALTFSLFLSRAAFRKHWLSVIATGILLLMINLGGENFALETPFAVLATLLMMVALLRFGILTLAVMMFTANLMVSAPLTLGLSNWFAAHSLFVLGVIVALLISSTRVAVGNRPLLGAALPE